MSSLAKEITEELRGDWYGTYGRIPGPGHSPKDRSVSIKDSAVLDDGVVVHSFAGDDPLAIKDRLRDKGLLPPRPGRDAPTGEPKKKSGSSIAYIYRTADGKPYLRVTRKPGKRFFQSSWGDGRWVNGAPKGEKIPYGLPEMLNAVHDTVFLVEGEKDADNLIARGFVATTCPGGANGWSNDLAKYFEGKTVYILRDNDQPGEVFAERAAASLYGIADSVRVCLLPGLPEKGDVSDWLEAGGDTSTLVALCKSFPVWRPTDSTISAADLQKLDLPPIEYVVPGLIPKGLTLVAGKPKVGKSWAMLGLGLALARGLPVLGLNPCRKQRVLYAALEDNPCRLKDRMETLLGDELWPDELRFEFSVPLLDQGGTEKLRTLCATHRIDVLIVDVFQKVRPSKGPRESDYAYDYRSLTLLKAVADELGISTIVVHHLRKLDGNDPLDAVSGTTGFTGAADAIITISKSADGNVVWSGRGRDLEDFEWPARLENGKWEILGAHPTLTPDQRRVIEVLRTAGRSMGPKEVSDIAVMKEDTARQLLRRLVNRGLILKVGYGQYCIEPSHCHFSEKSEKDQEDAA